MKKTYLTAFILLLIPCCWFVVGCDIKMPPVAVPEDSKAPSDSPVEQPDAPSDSPADSELKAVSDGLNPQSADASPQNDAPKAVSTAVSSVSDAMSANESWTTSFAAGKAILEKGDVQKASYYFANALGKDPGNMEVIETYRNALYKLMGASDDEAKFGLLSALEAFLQNQIASVETKDIETLLKWLAEIEPLRNKLEQSEEGEESDSPAEPQTSEEEILFAQLKRSMAEQSQYVTQSFKDGYQDIASYQLQECEQIMRGLIAIQPKINKAQKDEIAKIYADLQTLAQTLVDAKGKKVWDAYMVSYREYQTRRRDINNLQSCIEAAQKQLNALQKILPQLSEKYLGDMTSKNNSPDTAAACIQSLQSEIEQASIKQQQQYNEWALKSIKECLRLAKDGVGYWANGTEGRKTIANALIEQLGPIDQRFLTTEVSRCYQEVMGKYLADNQLNPPKTEESFEEPGNKMHTLKAMYDKTKKKLTDF